MPLSAPVLRFPFSKLLPLFPGAANEIHVNIPPNSTFAAGTVLGQVTTTANDVQTATITGTPTGGTFTIGNVPSSTGATTAGPFAYNATGATVQAALLAILGTGNVTTTGSAGGPYVVTFTGALASQPVAPLTYTAAFTGGTSPAITNVHTTTGASAGTYAAYASGNSDGTQNPELLMAYTVASDAAGNVYFATTAAGEWTQSYVSCPAYRKGTFKTQDLIGLDSNAVTKLGRLINGTVTTGIIQLI
jgi:hypothetical protein